MPGKIYVEFLFFDEGGFSNFDYFWRGNLFFKFTRSFDFSRGEFCVG